MAGLPTRFLRSVLGPKFRDPRPVEHPEWEMAAAAMNLLCQASIGHGLVAPRASLVASSTAGGNVITHQEEAWNDDHKQAHPALARQGNGTYTYTFASSYLDLDGTAVPTNLTAVRVNILHAPETFDQSSLPGAYAWIAPASPLVVQIRTWSGILLVDYPFWLEVL